MQLKLVVADSLIADPFLMLLHQYSKSTHLAKLPKLLNKRCNLKILSDLKCSKPVQHSLFCNRLHYFLPFGLGSAVNRQEEEDERPNFRRDSGECKPNTSHVCHLKDVLKVL